MKTVLSLIGTSSQCSLSSVGLSLARQHTNNSTEHQHQVCVGSAEEEEELASIPLRTNQMTAVASPLPLNNNVALTSHHHNHRHAYSQSPLDSHWKRSANGKRSRSESHTRHSLTPSPMEQPQEKEHSRSHGRSSYASSNSTSWMRRLSSSLSTSRDSHTRTPASRPGSAAVSYTNGSFAISHTGSSTPILLSSDSSPQAAATPTSAPLPRNKLVKRTSSLHSTKSSPGSRIPVFRRPATSHQRSVTLSGNLPSSKVGGRMPSSDCSPADGPTEWQPYFTPRIAADFITASKRRGSSSIPNPKRRIYPDRKYTPTLVSVQGLSQSITVEVDDGTSDYKTDMEGPDGQYHVGQSTASSPFPAPAAHFEEAASPRRSFSIGDLLSTGPQQFWRRPSTTKGRPRSSRSARRPQPRIASDSDAYPMGTQISKTLGHALERPAKRRELTDPKTSQRSIYSSSSSTYPFTSDAVYEAEIHLDGETLHTQYIPNRTGLSEPTSRAQTPDQDQNRLPSSTVNPAAFKPARLSVTASEFASTVGSDSDARSVDDNSTDYQSDNYYDSLPARTTRSSSGRRGPPIETIFDESPPTFSSGRSTKLRDFLSDGHEPSGRYSTIEEEGSVVSTPVRSLRNKSITSTPSARPGALQVFSSSPPMMHIMPDPDDIDWDSADEDRISYRMGGHLNSVLPPFSSTPVNHTLPFRLGPSRTPGLSAQSTAQRNGHSPMDKARLFEWAEPQPSPSHNTDSPPRPRTVHGKKDQDSRGSRPAGRRPASGMHARSHSVPVVPDLDGKRNNVVANKFGTWGVGSKGVTEDWNEDFEFDEPTIPSQSALDQDEKRIDSGHSMFVPKSIREQQQNVVANIGLLREWGLLIEELKELRIRAVSLEMLNGPYAQAWREVDAMIELADQESEEHTLQPRRTPPSSPGFDMTVFDGKTPAKLNTRPRHSSAGQVGMMSITGSVSDTPVKAIAPQGSPSITRPRKDSELVAQSVIAALRNRRLAGSINAESANPSSKKVPFDTATLRHIVPYVNGLKRQVKDGLRETEGLHSSPQRQRTPDLKRLRNGDSEEPAFRSIFNSPQDDDVMNRRQTRREQAATDNDEPESRLCGQMQKMSLLR